MTLRVYLDGTNAGIGPGCEIVVEGGIMSVGTANWSVGMLVIVAGGWNIDSLVTVTVGEKVGTLSA